ncbi:MAG: thiamine-phosphate kinase [Bacteroidales bacterium]|jgi:thiamine-monophosphate kinase|nr:thiamine-phosphate kinase [Bacteroidales bacterium]
MNISELGEFPLIKRLTEDIKIYHPKETIMGVGDDAAILAPLGTTPITTPTTTYQVVTTDLLVENVHFDLTYVPLRHLGYKAVAVNLSDVFAMNATPKQITVSIAVSSRFTVEALDELYAGIKLCCDKYKVDLAGGDTTSSTSGLIISVTALGTTEVPVKRDGAKENDILCVSGDLGSAYAGLQLLEKEKRHFLANPDMQPDFKDFSYVLERQLKPEPRADIIKLLRERGVRPTSMIDISDGLSSEILHIATASNAGAVIYENKIPIDTETYRALEQFNIMPLTAALNGGEDYELLFTVSPSDYDKIAHTREIRPIGHITEAATGCNLVPENGALIPLSAQGWQSFG